MLERLTPEQEARLREFRDFGLKIGLSTERTDREAADKAIRAHYRACGLDEPREIRWFDSPYDSVGASVWASVRASVGASVRDSVWDSVGAHYDADEAAWFMAWDQYGVSLPASALTMIEVSRHVWWYYPGREIVFASDRPTVIARDEAGRLHSETGKAIEFADGTGFSAWHGVTIPDEWVTNRLTIDPVEILRCQNVEQRAAGAACIGWARMLPKLDFRIIDSDPNPAHGELIEVPADKMGVNRPGRFLKAECPRNGTIVEGVPDNITTVLEAQAWRVGLTPSEFSYPTVRT